MVLSKIAEQGFYQIWGEGSLWKSHIAPGPLMVGRIARHHTAAGHSTVVEIATARRPQRQTRPSPLR